MNNVTSNVEPLQSIDISESDVYVLLSLICMHTLTWEQLKPKELIALVQRPSNIVLSHWLNLFATHL